MLKGVHDLGAKKMFFFSFFESGKDSSALRFFGELEFVDEVLEKEDKPLRSCCWSSNAK